MALCANKSNYLREITMQQPANEHLMIVMLDNLVQHSLPRTFAIRQKLERGEVLLSSEIDFFVEMLERVKHCQREFLEDAQCRVIFSTVAHLLFKVANLALENEQAIADPLSA
jgi:hypothetical protein